MPADRPPDRPPALPAGPFYANAGRRLGTVRYADGLPCAIGVLADLDGPPMPIGMALGTGWDGDGRAVWKLTVGGVELPGR